MPGIRHAIPLFVVALLSPLGPCAAADTLEASHAQTRASIQQTMQDHRIPGLQIAVIKDGRMVLSESYGLANVENQVAVTSRTRFPINSATKSFTGVAMMQLAEAGRVDLNAPVSRYLDGLPPTWQNVRVRQLLAHTSGLPNIVDRQGLIGGGTEQDAWTAVKALPLDAPSGDRFAYNQTNYGLLSQIIDKQAGVPYQQYVAEHQFRVAGMPTATFGDSYDPVSDAATIYSYARRRPLVAGDDDRLAHWFDELPPVLRTGGGIQSSAEDLARWLIALGDGRLITTERLKDMWIPEKLNSGADGRWAAGWPVLSATATDRQVAGIGGGRAAFVVYPDEQLAIIVLTNLVGASPEGFIPGIADFYRSSAVRRTASAPSL
ncbi:beta-lactamase family protein [Bacillus subtilis subsp. subtilis]|nr:beta-lactamase family protein [Bacillus subtilis subsp. subtilis]